MTGVQTCALPIYPLLFDLLLVNLLGNAIIHNLKNNGKIVINYHGSVLNIANTGSEKALRKDKIFQRYYRKTNNPESSGIGLSIIKKICDYYDIEISYSYRDHLHTFTLNLSLVTVDNE